ncbi:MAG: hypothetical protein EOM34_01220 [Clostridia bacterium]|nr:hypothetical protein [Clostridia bacterium]NCD01430.1 hypothetical protein [Clostridia bacterium]
MIELPDKEKVVNYGLIHIVDNDKDIKSIFNKKVYEDEFLKFYDIYVQSLTAYYTLYENSSHSDAYVREVALKIMDHEMEKINAIEKKSRREMQMMEDSAFAALFAIPAIVRYHTKATDLLADYLIEEWHKNFPKNQIQKGNFEEINSGFKKRKFCYITTAVCDSLNKGDNCYELNTLRSYRDRWLSREPYGEKLIEQYYDTAPGIIALINTRKDSDEIYNEIYKEYLQPCISYIERKEYEACRDTYIEMVKRLDRN